MTLLSESRRLHRQDERVRAIDAFVSHLDLAEFGHTSLELFIYGYLNQVGSSRGLD
jgi:hypothetical protein